MVGIIVFKVFLALVLVGYVSETLYSICVFTKLTQTTNKKMKDMGLILKKRSLLKATIENIKSLSIIITPFKNSYIADRIEEEGYDSASSSVINEFIKKGRCIETKPREPYPNEKEWKFEPKVMPQTTFTVSGKPGSSVKSNGLNNSLTEQFMEIYSRKDISFSEKEKLADELKEREKGISHNYR